MIPEDLTPEDWRYLSVLLAADIRRDRDHGLTHVPDRHAVIWHKIQPACQWAEGERE